MYAKSELFTVMTQFKYRIRKDWCYFVKQAFLCKNLLVSRPLLSERGVAALKLQVTQTAVVFIFNKQH